MLQRTTHYRFSTYGNSRYELPPSVQGSKNYKTTALAFSNKSFDELYLCHSAVYLECTSGIVLLTVSKDRKTYHEFVIHRVVELKPDIYFNMVSISQNAAVRIHIIPSDVQTHTCLQPYQYHRMVTQLHVNEILATYYQVRKGNYIFPGESHHYYELVYIDHGNLEMNIEDKSYSLSKYDLVLYYPGQFHAQHTKADQNCSYLTIVFEMEDELEDTMRNRVFHTRKDIYQVLCRFMKAVQSNDYLDQELAILYLKEVLILLHQFDYKEVQENAANPLQQHYENTLLNEILVYINNNIYNNFTVEDLCSKFSISRSSLQNLFRNNLHISPKQYISNVKLNQAKILIQQHSKRISEISDLLGYTSIHYFSRKFKAQFGMSPTDYSKSIHS